MRKSQLKESAGLGGANRITPLPVDIVGTRLCRAYSAPDFQAGCVRLIRVMG
jgi:hypothetical protein